MTDEEQKAFVKAYGNNVAIVKPIVVATFVKRFLAGEDIEYSREYNSILDSLLLWNDAVKWHMEASK